MTISSTATWELNRDELIGEGLMLCGQLNAAQSPKPEQIALGKLFLSSALQALQARGILLRSVARYSQVLSDGVTSYVAPTDTIDIEKDAIIRTAAELDIPIMKMDRAEYQAKSNKSFEAQPTHFYVEESTGGVKTIYMYPTPDTDYTLIYPRVARLRDVDTGVVTVDASPVFLEAFGWMLAWKFSIHYKQSLERAMTLKGYYDEAIERAMSDETPRGPVRFTVAPLFGGG